MPIRVTLDQVRAHTLARQCLVPKRVATDVLDVVRCIGPLRARPTTTPYLALWARMADFCRASLQRALYEERTLVRASYARGDLYVMPAEDLPYYHQATFGAEAGAAAGYVDYLAGTARGNGQADEAPSELIPRVLEVVSTRGPCTLEELIDWLPPLGQRLTFDGGAGEEGSFRLANRLIPAMCSQGLLVRAQPRGSWRSDLDSYVSLRTWLPHVRLDAVTPREALAQVLRLYLRAFGPVTIGDMTHWLGGARRHRVVTGLMALEQELARVEITGAGEAYLLREDLDALHAPPEPEERLVRLLPPRDGLLMAYRDTARVLAAEHHDRVFDWAGESQGVVLVDGWVSGVWWQQSRADRIVVRLLRELDPEAMALLGEEARDLGEFLGLSPIDIEIRPDQEESDGEMLALLPLGILPER